MLDVTMAGAHFEHEHGLTSHNTTIREITDEDVEKEPTPSKRGANQYAIAPVSDALSYGLIKKQHPSPAVSHLKLITPVPDVLRHAFVEERHQQTNAVSDLKLGDASKGHDMQLNGFHKHTLDTNPSDLADSLDDASERYDTPVGFTPSHNANRFRSFKEMNMTVSAYTTDHKEREMLNNEDRALVKVNDKPVFKYTGQTVFEDSDSDASFVKSNHDCQVSLSSRSQESASDASPSIGFQEKYTYLDDLHDSLDREAELTFDDFLSYCEKEWKTFYSKMNKDARDEWHEFCSMVDRENACMVAGTPNTQGHISNMAVGEGNAGCSSHIEENSTGNERTVLQDAPSDDLCLKQFQGLSLMETYIQVKRMCGLVRERLDTENRQHPDVSILAHDYIVTLLDGYRPYQPGIGNLESLLQRENCKPDLTEIMDTMWFGDRSGR